MLVDITAHMLDRPLKVLSYMWKMETADNETDLCFKTENYQLEHAQLIIQYFLLLQTQL